VKTYFNIKIIFAVTQANHFSQQGDLAKKKIYPTLWWLFRDNLLPQATTFIGYARSDLSVQALRAICEPYMKVQPDEEERHEEFWRLNYYVMGSYDSYKNFEKLNREIEKHETGPFANRLFYLALPPSVFEDVTVHIRHICMAKK
jgi:glucose-6-phosphate 1-dehydrogenase